MTATSPYRRIFFVHIPKCAGSTIDYMLRFHYGLRAMNVRDRSDEERLTGEALAFAARLHPGFVAASGHGLFLSPEVRALYPEAYWFTILREPRARYVSHYEYLRQKKGLEESMEAWAGRKAMRNLQVRWLAGEENLQKAIDAMETLFHFVGRLDQLDLSLAMISKASGLGFQVIKDYKKNVSKPTRPELSEETQAQILENNALDFQLWDYFQEHIWPRQLGDVDVEFPLSPVEMTLSGRVNLALNLALRGAVYAPLLSAKQALSR